MSAGAESAGGAEGGAALLPRHDSASSLLLGSACGTANPSHAQSHASSHMQSATPSHLGTRATTPYSGTTFGPLPSPGQHHASRNPLLRAASRLADEYDPLVASEGSGGGAAAGAGGLGRGVGRQALLECRELLQRWLQDEAPPALLAELRGERQVAIRHAEHEEDLVSLSPLLQLVELLEVEIPAGFDGWQVPRSEAARAVPAGGSGA